MPLLDLLFSNVIMTINKCLFIRIQLENREYREVKEIKDLSKSNEKFLTVFSLRDQKKSSRVNCDYTMDMTN